MSTTDVVEATKERGALPAGEAVDISEAEHIGKALDVVNIAKALSILSGAGRALGISEPWTSWRPWGP